MLRPEGQAADLGKPIFGGGPGDLGMPPGIDDVEKDPERE